MACTSIETGVDLFQSTLPREERPQCDESTMAFRNFNPRSHERSDTGSREEIRSQEISIHAPTRGATVYRQGNIHDRRAISIHAPTRGATVFGGNYDISTRFQSTLPREERHPASFASCSSTRFQSTLPREERRSDPTEKAKPANFNPRSHERSDSNIAQKICLFLYNTDNKYIIR